MGHSSSGDSGWGFDFEREVSCALLVLMAENGCLWLSDEEEVECVWPQVHKEGIETDDIRVCLKNRRTKTARDLYIQCKSTVRCAKTRGTPFFKAVSKAFRDYVRLMDSCDVFALACAPLSGASSLLPDFLHTIKERPWDQVAAQLVEKQLEPEYEKLFKIFSQIAKVSGTDTKVTDEIVYNFLCRYYVFHPDIMFRYGLEESFMLSALRNLGVTLPEDKINVLRSFVAVKAKASGKIRPPDVIKKLRIDNGFDGVSPKDQFRDTSRPSSMTLLVDGAPEGDKAHSMRPLTDAISRHSAAQFENSLKEGDVEFIDTLIDDLHDGAALYEFLCWLAKRIVDSNVRSQASKLAMRLLAHQMEKGNNGIVFDLFAYLLSPQIPLDSKENRWRGGWVQTLLRIDEKIGWEILCSQVVSEKMPPLTFLNLKPSDFDNDLLKEYQDYALGIAQREWAKLVDLIARLPLVDSEFFGRIVGCIRVSAIELTESDRNCVYTALLDAWIKIVEWPFFSESREQRSAMLLGIVEEVSHSNYEPLLKAVFSVSDGMLDSLDALRKRLLIQFMNKQADNPRGVFDIAGQVRHPDLIGACLAGVKGIEYDGRLFGVALQRYSNPCVKDVARAYAWTRYNRQDGASWVETFDTTNWSTVKVANFYALLPVEPRIWMAAEKLESEGIKTYWRNIKVYLPRRDIAVEYGHVVLRLSEYGRTMDSLLAWSFMKSQGCEAPFSIVATMLEGIVDGNQSVDEMWEAFHRIQSALKDLHKGPITEVMRVARLEWYFNALFANRTIEAIDASCCNKRMAFDPVFFVKVVKGLSEGKRAPKKIDYSRGAKVLNTWRAVPGVDAGGATGDKEFQVWMDKVLEQTRNNDVCKNRCLKWIGSCLAKLTIPNASLFSMEGMWSFVDSGEGLVVRNEFEKVLKNTGLMPCIFNHKGRETMKDLYFKFYSMAKEYGYNNVALSYKGALEHIEGLQPLA